jgi:hypothetical protein
MNLDLQAPASSFAAQDMSARAGLVFPSPPNRRAGNIEPIELPDLGASGAPIRVPTKMERLVRNAHREGVPFARLWENRRMMLSLGLDPKGKPGLWLVQKVP